MCNQPDFELPASFIEDARAFEADGTVKPDAKVLISKISEQTGLSEESISAALANAGLAAFRAKGILF